MNIVSTVGIELSDAGLRQHRSKLLYPNHRFPLWLTEIAARDRSNRWLGGTAMID
jgi:hypothetical protein